MKRPRRDRPMPVRYWSSAGIMLTYWCNARCASCYVGCGPDKPAGMTVEFAVGLWRELIEASPHGCRIHLTGGEPFGDYRRLIELCREAQAQGLGPLQKIETNAFWATDEGLVRSRLAELDEAGMGKLSISADPYHQQFVPIERCRLAARVAQDVLGAERVQVRWRSWLASGFDTADLTSRQRRELFVRHGSVGRDRMTGRAAETIAPHLQCKSWREFADKPCAEPLLRSKHVHVDPAGRVMPGTCAGIVLGVVGREDVASIWRALAADHADRPVVATLAGQGPVGLMAGAEATGFRPGDAYASKCHLCWTLRRHLAGRGMYERVLAPSWLYGIESDPESAAHVE